jgi:hypothetical protein
MATTTAPGLSHSPSSTGFGAGRRHYQIGIGHGSLWHAQLGIDAHALAKGLHPGSIAHGVDKAHLLQIEFLAQHFG